MIQAIHDLSSRRKRGGFTLIELMLVVIIIGVIAAIVVPRLTGRTERARLTATKQTIASVSGALDAFELELGRFPTAEEGLEALVVRPPALTPEDEWNGPYLREVPRDPWNRVLIYRSPPEQSVDFDLISAGRDGEEGTDDDVTNFRREQ